MRIHIIMCSSSENCCYSENRVDGEETEEEFPRGEVANTSAIAVCSLVTLFRSTLLIAKLVCVLLIDVLGIICSVP